MQVAIADCETTGLGPNDQPISIAVVLTDIDHRGHGIISDSWYGEQYPSVPISVGAFAVHGRTRESLAGKAFNFESLTEQLASVDLIVAHNAEFDARMIAKVYPEIQNLPWFCSYKQWPFGRLPNKRLDTLCEYFKIEKPTIHDAISDATCLYKVLIMRQGKTDRSKTYLHRLIQKSAWIAPVSETPAAPTQASSVVKVHDFDREAMQQLHVGTRIPLESNPQSDVLTAFERRHLLSKAPVLSVLKSENPQVAEKLEAGATVYVVVVGNDGRHVELDFRSE